MSNPQHPSAGGAAHTVSPEHATSNTYDVVIVGSGISGSLLAWELTKAHNYRVLIVEAGLGQDLSQHGYQRYLENFYGAPSKDNQAPFPRNPNAEMPRSNVLRKLKEGETNDDAYWVQYGPYVSDSVYSRVLGGTTVHWEAKTIRMLRDDFKLQSNYHQGLDWPIGLDDLLPYYEQAEFILGSSGNVEEQKRIGVEFSQDYCYPMVELRPSYLDQIVAKRSAGMVEELDGEKKQIDWVTFPQAKNADPNPGWEHWQPAGGDWKQPGPYKPVGAVSLHQTIEGERCQGNTNCVPLCPVQARFDARKILVKALQTGRVELLSQAVASHVFVNPDNGEITGIEIKHYENRGSTESRKFVVHGKLYILAASAVENARLMLSSAVRNGQPANDLMGRHLMDHPYLLCWGLLPENAGTYRGPSCTSGLCNFRRGQFRHRFASFATDIHNDGWGWATGAPFADLVEFVDQNSFGRDLRNKLTERISRQLLLAHMIELPAEKESRVTVDPQKTDHLGNMRPVVNFKFPDYSLAAAEYVHGLSQRIFDRIGAKDFTNYSEADYGHLTHNGKGYCIRGGNHLAGTHVMGHKGASVVDENQKSWDHSNLYLAGPGSMPSIGSSNTTLTVTAICLRTAKTLLRHLESLKTEL